MKNNKLNNILYITFSITIWYIYFSKFIEVIMKVIKYGYFYKVFIPSFSLGYIIVKFLVKKGKEYFLTISHENNHQIMAILLLSLPKEFHVDKDGSGYLIYNKRFLDRIIVYAPYFFFPLPLLLIFISLFLKSNTLYFFIGIYGMAIGYRLAVIIRDLKTYRIQTDITKYGTKISLFTISAFLLLFFGILVSYLLSPFSIDGIKFFLIEIDFRDKLMNLIELIIQLK